MAELTNHGGKWQKWAEGALSPCRRPAGVKPLQELVIHRAHDTYTHIHTASLQQSLHGSFITFWLTSQPVFLMLPGSRSAIELNAVLKVMKLLTYSCIISSFRWDRLLLYSCIFVLKTPLFFLHLPLLSTWRSLKDAGAVERQCSRSLMVTSWLDLISLDYKWWNNTGNELQVFLTLLSSLAATSATTIKFFFVSDINTDDLSKICPLGDQCMSQTLATGPVNMVQDHMADFDWLIFF